MIIQMKNAYLILLLFISFNSNAQTNQQLAAQLDAFIQTEMSQNNIPGLAASIVKEGQVVWKNAYGLAHIANNTPVTLTTEFTLASISKLFTATACAQLWEQGLLDIDADINNYLPVTIVNPNHPTIPITTRQLLNHKSSLRDFETDLQLWVEQGDPIIDLATFCEDYFIAGGSLYDAANWGSAQPGNAAYWYSNAGFTLLGLIVQQASGMDFNDYVKQTILMPLNMPTAGWFYNEVDINDVAMPYNSQLNPYGYYSVPEYPAAMLKANIEELSNFLIAYTQAGVFGNNSLFNTTTFNSIVPANMTLGFAWWGTDTWYGDPTGNFWSHGGYMNGVRTQLNYYPDDETGLIILTNGQGSYAQIQDTLEAYIPQFETCDFATAIVNPPNIIIDGTPSSLTGIPTGGTFSGPGIIFNAFNPTLVQPGNHTIYYTYSDAYGCQQISTHEIYVGSVSYNFVNYNLGTIAP